MTLDTIKNRISRVDRTILLAGISLAEAALHDHDLQVGKKGSCFNFTMRYEDPEGMLSRSYLKAASDSGTIEVSCNRHRLRLQFHPTHRRETAPALTIREDHPMDIEQPKASKSMLFAKLERWMSIATLEAGPEDWEREERTLKEAAKIAGALLEATMPGLALPATTTVLLPSEYAAMAVSTSRDAEWIPFADDATTRWFVEQLHLTAKTRRVEAEWKSERNGRSTRMSYDLSEAIRVNPARLDAVETMRIMSEIPVRLAA